MTKETISFIINPISGRHNKDALPKQIRAIIDSSRYVVRTLFTERAGHAFELATSQVAEGVNFIVAVGGDGTVNEIAAALRDTSAALGIVPCGSGNGLARHLKIPLNRTKALKFLNDAVVTSIDYGLVDNRPFFCTFGVGFDARIAHVFASSKKRGFFTYLIAIVKEFFGYSAKKYRLKIDGKKIKTRAMILTVANAAQYGNNGFIAPKANIADGKLDVCFVRPFPKIITFFLALRLISKKLHKSPYYCARKGKDITIVRKNKGEVHLDGEPFYMGKKLKLKIAHNGLKVLSPL